VHAPLDVERLDPQSRHLAAHPPVDDPWADRGVVDILRTRALIAEITGSLIRLRDLAVLVQQELPTVQPRLKLVPSG
jgi:hypothetical protein